MELDDNDKAWADSQPTSTDSLRELCGELARTQAQARELGIFVGDRPLLRCSVCGLTEDVTAEGFLVVYPGQRLNLESTQRVTQGWDTSQRFADLSEGTFLCPACGGNLLLVDEESSGEDNLTYIGP